MGRMGDTGHRPGYKVAGGVLRIPQAIGYPAHRAVFAASFPRSDRADEKNRVGDTAPASPTGISFPWRISLGN